MPTPTTKQQLKSSKSHKILQEFYRSGHPDIISGWLSSAALSYSAELIECSGDATLIIDRAQSMFGGATHYWRNTINVWVVQLCHNYRVEHNQCLCDATLSYIAEHNQCLRDATRSYSAVYSMSGWCNSVIISRVQSVFGWCNLSYLAECIQCLGDAPLPLSAEHNQCLDDTTLLQLPIWMKNGSDVQQRD